MLAEIFFGEGILQSHSVVAIGVRCMAIALIAGLASKSAHAEDSVDAAAAAKQFLNSCGVCHTVEPGAEIRQGPNLGKAFGRTAGTLAEFPGYSDALKKAGAGGLAWNEDNLDKWIESAATYIPGANMMYVQPDAAKRKLIIAYLKSLGGAGSPPAK